MGFSGFLKLHFKMPTKVSVKVGVVNKLNEEI